MHHIVFFVLKFKFIFVGFQLLRCVCFYCSRLMVDKDAPRVKEILKKTAGNPRRRLTAIYDLCKSKSVCEGGDELHTVGGEVFELCFEVWLFDGFPHFSNP